MKPRAITDNDLDEWFDRSPRPATFTGPGEEEAGIEPCPALVLSGDEIAVPYELNEIEVVRLAKGGTLWLICRGSLPVHGMYVSEP